MLPPLVVTSEVDPEVACVVASRLVDAPVAVPPLAPEVATKAVTFADIVDQHPFIVRGNFLLSRRKAYNNLFRSGVREVLMKKAGF